MEGSNLLLTNYWLNLFPQIPEAFAHESRAALGKRFHDPRGPGRSPDGIAPVHHKIGGTRILKTEGATPTTTRDRRGTLSTKDLPPFSQTRLLAYQQWKGMARTELGCGCRKHLQQKMLDVVDALVAQSSQRSAS